MKRNSLALEPNRYRFHKLKMPHLSFSSLTKPKTQDFSAELRIYQLDSLHRLKAPSRIQTMIRLPSRLSQLLALVLVSKWPSLLLEVLRLNLEVLL